MKSRAYTRRYLWYHRWLLVQHLVKPVADSEWSHQKIRLTHGRAWGWRWWTFQFVSLVNSGWQERMSFSFRTVRPVWFTGRHVVYMFSCSYLHLLLSKHVKHMRRSLKLHKQLGLYVLFDPLLLNSFAVRRSSKMTLKSESSRMVLHNVRWRRSGKFGGQMGS